MPCSATNMVSSISAVGAERLSRTLPASAPTWTSQPTSAIAVHVSSTAASGRSVAATAVSTRRTIGGIVTSSFSGSAWRRR